MYSIIAAGCRAEKYLQAEDYRAAHRHAADSLKLAACYGKSLDKTKEKEVVEGTTEAGKEDANRANRKIDQAKKTNKIQKATEINKAAETKEAVKNDEQVYGVEEITQIAQINATKEDDKTQEAEALACLQTWLEKIR